MLFFPPRLTEAARTQWLNAIQHKGRRARGVTVREYAGSVLQSSSTSMAKEA